MMRRCRPSDIMRGASIPAALMVAPQINGFAEELNVRLRVETRPTIPEVLDALERGEGHLAAAGIKITPERKGRASVT